MKKILLLLFVWSGTLCWAGNWPIPAHTWGGSQADVGGSIALDASGNVYAAGSTQSFGAGGTDVLITKYGPKGQFLWAKTWGGVGDDYASSIRIGPDGYLYVSGGTSSFGAGSYDLMLLKLDTNGNLKWGTTWGGGSYEGGYDIAFDAAGDIYVVGETYSTSPCCTAVLLKFSTSGELLQTLAYKGPASYDAAYSLTVDKDFNVIVAGISWDYDSNPSLHNSLLLLKYDASGNLLWQENYATPYPAQDESGGFHSLTTDSNGNIYIYGRHSTQCTDSDFNGCDFDTMLLKMDPNGVFLWASTSGELGTLDTAGSVVLDAKNHVLVSGLMDWWGTPQLFVEKFGSGGNLMSQMAWKGTTQPSAVGMALGSAGDVFVSGSALNNSGKWSTTTSVNATLSNVMLENTYSLPPISNAMYPLTTPTVLQTAGVRDSGGGASDAFVAHHFAP